MLYYSTLLRCKPNPSKILKEKKKDVKNYYDIRKKQFYKFYINLTEEVHEDVDTNINDDSVMNIYIADNIYIAIGFSCIKFCIKFLF